MQSLSQLFYLYGIGYEYTKYTGEHVVFDENTRACALRCCGIHTDDINTIEQLNFTLDAGNWLNLLPPVSLVSAENRLLKVRIDERLLEHHCELSIPSLGITANRESFVGLDVLELDSCIQD